MKKFLVIGIMVAMIASMLTSCSSSDKKQTVSSKPDDNAEIRENTPDTPITLAVNSVEVVKGDIFTFSINMQNDEWFWNSFEFIGTYDPTLIKIRSITKTELTQDMADATNINYGKDGNQFKVAYASGLDIEGGGDIIEIECQALKSGVCEIKISDVRIYRWVTYVATGEGNTQEVPVNILNGVVTVLSDVQEVAPDIDSSDADKSDNKN